MEIYGLLLILKVYFAMISVNVACEVAGAIGLVKARNLLEYALDTVLSRMKDQEYGCILEKKKSNGDRIDSQDALFLNVGHVFESMWFAIDAARLLGRKELIPEIISISENTFRLGTEVQILHMEVRDSL